MVVAAFTVPDQKTQALGHSRVVHEPDSYVSLCLCDLATQRRERKGGSGVPGSFSLKVKNKKLNKKDQGAELC